MMNWLRPVLPPAWTVVLFVALYVPFEGGLLYFEFTLGPPFDVQSRPGMILLGAACLFFGAFRGGAFHPLFRAGYRDWLKATPWTAAKALPLGPVHFVWQDGVILAALGAIGWLQQGFHPLWVVPLVLAGWLLPVGVSLRRTGAWGFDYAVWFGLGLMLWLAREPVACAAAAVVTYLVAWVGLRRSLARFPWEGTADGSLLNLLLTQQNQTPIYVGWSFGWPFDHLRPKFPPYLKIHRTDAALTSLLTGWLLYATSCHVKSPSDRAEMLTGLHALGLGGLALTRLFLYWLGYLPPISLLGRLRTGRWIIPGYDKMFLAPLGVLAVAVVAPGLFLWWGVAPEYGLPISLALGTFLALAAGPGLTSWRLTGNHRIVSGMWVSSQQGFLKVG